MVRYFFFSILLTLTFSQAIVADTLLADIFTDEIYDQSNWRPEDLTAERKIYLFKCAKERQLKNKVTGPLYEKIYKKEIELAEMSSDISEVGAMVAVPFIELGMIVGRLFKKNTEVIAYDDGGEYKKAQTTKKLLAFAHKRKDKIVRDIGDLNEYRHKLTKAATSGELYDLECKYMVRKSGYPTAWQTKIEELLLQAYGDKDFCQKERISAMINYPYTLKTFTPQKRTQLRGRYEIGSTKWDLVTKLTNTTTPFCAHFEMDDSSQANTQITEIADHIGLPVIIKDAAEIDHMIGNNAGEQAVIDLFYGTETEKGIWLSALSNPQNVQNPILVIKNADAWIRTGNPKLSWLMRATDQLASTFDSPYFECRVDWSHLNIIFVCSNPLLQATEALVSRMRDNSYYGFDD